MSTGRSLLGVAAERGPQRGVRPEPAGDSRGFEREKGKKKESLKEKTLIREREVLLEVVVEDGEEPDARRAEHESPERREAKRDTGPRDDVARGAARDPRRAREDREQVRDDLKSLERTHGPHSSRFCSENSRVSAEGFFSFFFRRVSGLVTISRVRTSLVYAVTVAFHTENSRSYTRAASYTQSPPTLTLAETQSALKTQTERSMQ